MALALCEGEINSIEQIFIDDKLVTWSGSLNHGVIRNVNSSDVNFYLGVHGSQVTVQPFLELIIKLPLAF